ncbi:MAG: DUF1616 domain-containing protein [Candidatus Bathyarchaeota archaeon]|nr:DUF1616 domain-containing protein [Candidatus Bathyarchaeota archaeon]
MSWVFDEEVLAVIAAILIVSAVFAAVQVLNAGRVVEPFSELGLLGPGGKIADYPRVVGAGQPFRLNVYVGNHEGRVMYYRVLVKVGDKNSTVNETTPMAAEPMMELRTILAHNTSEVLPIDVVLKSPAENVRLVFEMWVYNETAGAFTYHGRWNQLWLNVTGDMPQPTQPQTGNAGISPTLEESIIAGYLAVRRAETNGGDVSEMVGFLRRALSRAMAGDAEETRSLAMQAFSMEPEVSRAGIEAGRLRLFMGVGGLAAVAAVGIGGYTYLREKFWVYLARLYRGWRLVLRQSENGSLNDVEKAVKRLIKSNSQINLENLVFSSAMGYKPSLLAKTVFSLVRKGSLELVNPNPPKSFSTYLRSMHGLGFMASAGLVCLCIITVYLSSVLPALSVLRMALGSLFVLFLPGYSLVEALYPRREELSPLERLALSIGLSLALVPLIGLVLNYTPWGIRLDPIMVSLSLLTLGLLLASAYRKYRIERGSATA